MSFNELANKKSIKKLIFRRKMQESFKRTNEIEQNLIKITPLFSTNTTQKHKPTKVRKTEARQLISGWSLE